MFQDRFAVGQLRQRLELISLYEIPVDRLKEQMEPDHELLSLVIDVHMNN